MASSRPSSSRCATGPAGRTRPPGRWTIDRSSRCPPGPPSARPPGAPAMAESCCGTGTTLAEAAELVAALSDEDLARRPDALRNLAGANVFADRYEAAALDVERAFAVERTTGHQAATLVTTLGQARCLQ